VQPPGQRGPARPPQGAIKIILGVRPSESGSHDSAFCNHDMLLRSLDRPGLIRHLTNLSAPRLWEPRAYQAVSVDAR